MLSLKNSHDVMRETRAALKNARLTYGWRQVDLARRSGVPVATLRRFERTGCIGFAAFARLLVALRMADRFLENLRVPLEAVSSINAFMEQGRNALRQRASGPRRKKRF